MKLFPPSFFAIVFFMACNTKPKKICKPYFQFDLIEHYSIEISFDEEMKLMELDSLSKAELRLNDVLFQSQRTKLEDTVHLKNLEEIGFVKRNVAISKFEAVNQLFCEKNHEELTSTACIQVYRDVLLFKRKGQIIGTVKVCFDCGDHVIAGVNVNTYDFGQEGDYRRLKTILYPDFKTK